MKQACPSPIHQDNFNEVWTYTDQKRRTAKKKSVTSKVASFFTGMVFTALLFVAANGLIHDHLSGSYCSFLETVPLLLPLWQQYSGMFLKQVQGPLLQSAVTLLVIIGICFIVSGIFTLLVTALYHPFKKKLPAASVKENAEALLSVARDARRYANRTGSGMSVIWGLVFSAGIFFLISMYWLLALGDLETITQSFTGAVMALLSPYIDPSIYSSIQSSILIPCIMVFCVGIYLVHALLSGIQALTVQFMYKYHVPYSFVAEMERYSIFADENVSGLTPEEIDHLHRDQAGDKRIQALEYERMGAHARAKALLAEAAHGGDIQAMEHYARHWLIAGVKDPARYWLEQAVSSGQASEEAVKHLKRLKWRRRVQVHYLT